MAHKYPNIAFYRLIRYSIADAKRADNFSSSHSVTRRDTLKVIGAVGASIFLSGLARFLKDLTAIPSVAELDDQLGYDPEQIPQDFEPGWIERALP